MTADTTPPAADLAPGDTRLAIATGAYHRPQETQINFHVATLFGGEAVVLARKPEGPPPDTRPCLYWGRRAMRQGHVTTLAELSRAVWRYGADRSLTVPQGMRRRAILRFLDDHGVDVLLAEFGSEAVRLAPVAEAAGLPIYAYFRGADASVFLRRRERIAAYRRMMPRLAGVFSVSRFLLDRLAAHGIAHPNAHVVPSGVDTDRFVPAEKRLRSYLAVGRFVGKKRPDLTVRAFCDATRDHPDAHLEMVGDGPLLAECRRIAAERGGRVTFPGARPHAEIAARLATAQVFLQHSVTGADGDTEGLPTSIQEAMSAGLVTISTRHAGIPEAVVDGETGYLVAEGDEAAFRDRIARSLAGDANLAAMSAAARDRAVAHFDNRRLVRKVEAELARTAQR